MFCEANTRDPFRCPTRWELWESLIGLLPSGRAWQTHEQFVDSADGGPGIYGAYQLGASGLNQEGASFNPRFTVLQAYWYVFSGILEYWHARCCLLLEEYFCSTANETRREWEIDYGFPDPCEPWRTLCQKVAAQGGATCAYLQSIAAALNWTITCTDCGGLGNTSDRAGNMMAGADCNAPCQCEPNTMIILVSLDDSPAYTGSFLPPQAGLMRAGCEQSCGPNIDGLRCLIERYKPAHVRADYQFVTN